MDLSKLRVFIGAMFLCLAPLLAFGQSNRGRINGTVTDQTGASIAGAKVTIENLGTHVLRELTTNGEGNYVATDIEPGFYSVKAELANFKTIVREKIQVEVANDLKIDFRLVPGAVTETVEVSEQAPLTDTSNAVLDGVLSNKAVNDLPVQGRDFQNLLNLHPGVQRSAGGGFHSTTSNGLRPDDNNYIIDGANDNDAYWGETVVNDAGISGTPASTLPLDAIQEFNTQEQPQADFGAKPGVVVNIGIKSGTDQIHGTAYYFNRNAAFDARNYFNPSPQETSALGLHQFGASIGGPIIKGKWFYFADYEGVRSKVGNPYNAFTPVTTSLVGRVDPSVIDPTEFSIPDALHDLGCDVTPTNCNALSLSLLKYFPKNTGFTANANDPTIVNFDFNNLNRADNLVFKSDYHFNEHHTLTGRFIYANTTETEEDAVPVAPQWLSHAQPITQVFGLDWTWTPNSRWSNSLRFSYNRFYEKISSVDSNVDPTTYGLNTGITDPRLFGFPRINASTKDFNYLGGNSSWPAYTSPSHTQNISDTASFTFGKHTLRFGGVFSDGGVDLYRANTGRGRVDFHYLEDFLTGNVRSWGLLFGDPTGDITMKSVGFFLQDDYRITRRVTLNLGLRYDVTFPIKDDHDRLANFDPTMGLVQVGSGISEPYQTKYNNVSPRLGVAWDIFGTGKTVLRSGFGMIYVQPSIRSFAFSGGGLNLNPSALPKVLPDGTVLPGNGTMKTLLVSGADPSLLNWNTTGGTIFPINAVSSNQCSFDEPCPIFATDPHLKTPYVLNWNLNIQQQITPSSVLQIAYVANHGVKLYSTIDQNQASPSLVSSCVDGGGDYSTCQQSARPFSVNCPVSQGGTGSGASCFPYFNFVNTLGNKSTSTYNSLQVTFTKRYSKGLYLLAGYTYGHAIDTAGNTDNLGFAPQNSLDYNAEKGDGDFDIRHRFTFSATYELPSRKSWGQLLEGWQVNSIFTYESGVPILMYDVFDDLTGTYEGPGNGNNDRWNILGSPKNLKWSASTPIPSFNVVYADDGTVLSRPAQCTAVANTQALLDALDYVGFCYSQNGTTLYPNAFYTFGNMGRNIFRGPGFVNLDFSVVKNWNLNEKLKLQLRGEVFNLFNHPNFSPGSVGGDLSDTPSLGLASATPDVQTANPVVGSGGSRHIQLGAKFIW